MNAHAQKRPRNSRWSRDPIVDGEEPVVARITDRDVEIFKLLSRYHYLPSDDIHAFVGGGLVHLTRRLDLLQRKPNCYLNRPHQQRENAEANYRRLIYELDEPGSRVLRDRGLPVPPKTYYRNFAHELMVCRIMASIELGGRADPSLRLISWQEILASDRTPQPTRSAPRPERIPVAYEIRHEQCRTEICADAFPFGIERSDSGKRSFLFFPGIEADCATEPLDANDVERSSIYKKFAAYRAIVSQDIHRTHFGFPNFFVPFITTSDTRMQSMMRLLEKMTDGRIGSLGTVIGGPTTAGGYTWWQVNYDNAISGWSISTYLLPAATNASPAVGMTSPAKSSLSLIQQLMQQVQALSLQLQSLQSQMAGAGAAVQ